MIFFNKWPSTRRLDAHLAKSLHVWLEHAKIKCLH